MLNLAEQLTQDAGLTSEQASKAMKLTTDYLKLKFPRALHQEIDAVMNNGNFGDAFKSNLKDFGDKAEDTAKEVTQKADEMLTELREKLKDLFNPKKSS